MKAFLNLVKDFLTATAKMLGFMAKVSFLAVLVVFFLSIFFRENVQGAFELFKGLI